MIEPQALHFSVVRAPESRPARALLFLHGILGSGANLRGLAQRVTRADPSLLAVLVDLRGHGRSPDLTAPHTLDACARDVAALEPALELPVSGVIGHSFGGKVALAYHALRPTLARVALLDSTPSARPERAGSEETYAVLAMLEAAPRRYESRTQFIEYVRHEGHSRAVAEWLAMNLVRAREGLVLRIQLPMIRALLDDYFSRDLWHVVEGSAARIDLIVAGHSEVYGEADLARAGALAPRVHTHFVKDAGHWVHADAPEQVAAALST